MMDSSTFDELFAPHLSTFDDLLDSGELDPRPRMKKAVRPILKFEMQHVPPELAAELVYPRLKVLGKALVEIIEGRDTRKWIEMVFDLRDDLRNTIDRERANGRLKPWSAASEIDKHILEFSKWRYHSRAIDHLRSRLNNGEKIIGVEPREIRTNVRTLTRVELEAGCRSVTERSDRSFAQQFITEAALADLIAEDAKNRNPEVAWAATNRSVLGPQ